MPPSSVIRGKRQHLQQLHSILDISSGEANTEILALPSRAAGRLLHFSLSMQIFDFFSVLDLSISLRVFFRRMSAAVLSASVLTGHLPNGPYFDCGV